MFSAFGAIGVGALLSMRWLCARFNDVQLIVGGLCFMLLSTAMFLVDSESNLGYPTFVFSVGMQYGAAYPIGHTAVIGEQLTVLMKCSLAYTSCGCSPCTGGCVLLSCMCQCAKFRIISSALKYCEHYSVYE
jgi:hypothetical protein